MPQRKGMGAVIASMFGLLITGCLESHENVSPSEKPPVSLYEEVKRLNAACVQAGGGVSGSPNCDASIVAEEKLESLGYCIDYPNGEVLARCDDLTWRP